MSNQEGSLRVINVPDELCDAAGLNIQWGGIGNFGVYAYQYTTYDSKDVPSEFAHKEAKIHQVRPHSILFEPVIRKLLNESNGIFLAGQKLTPSNTSRPATLKLSRQYRSIIRACTENIQITNELDDTKKKDYQAIFYNIELIWHLCEIMFVDAVPGHVVLPFLLDWVRFHFPDAETRVGQILSSFDPGADKRHSDYWDVITSLIIQGNIDASRALLLLHSDENKDTIQEANLVLRSLPSFTVYGGLSISEFKTRWHTWQTNVISKIQCGVFSSIPELERIMKIVSGEDSIIDEMKMYCDTWYQLMIALILYKEPTVKSFDLSSHAHLCIDVFGGLDNLKLLDEVILSIFECNILEVIKKLYYMSDSGWCATHLTNLLYFCGHLNVDDSNDLNGRIDENLMIEYGSLLMSHSSLWQVGLTYLDHCPTQGQACIELLLPRLPLGSEARVLKIIQAAAERNLPHIVNSICKVQGMRCLKRKRIAQAFCWALRSLDAGFATHLADLLLKQYTHEGFFQSLDFLDNLGSCMLVSDRLTFLGKYCEFHRLYRNDELKDAAKLLTSLFTSKLCPKYFWLTLLMDSLPLLDSHDYLFASEDICELMSSLEELNIENEDNSDSAKTSAERTKLLKLAMGKNLAKSLIYEACVH